MKMDHAPSEGADAKMGTASRIVWAAITAIPITLMVLGGCVSYAQLLIQNTPLDINVVVASFNFSIGIAMLAKNFASHCPYTMSSADMTLQLFLRQTLAGIAALGLSEKETVATMWVALHVSSFILGAIFIILGRVRAAIALSYLPYPVVAGFLAMIGGSIVKGGITLLWPKDGESVYPLILGIVLAASSTLAKAVGIPSNLSSVLAIVVSIVGFWTWVYWGHFSTHDLRQTGWLFPQRAESVPPLEIWTQVDWRDVHWSAIIPGADSMMLALVACINRALTITGIEAAVGESSYSIDDEMLSTGVATCVTGTIGGVIMNPTSGMSSLCSEGCEGDTRMARVAVFISAGIFMSIWGSGIPLTNYLPRFMLGGLLMMMGVGMLVDWAWHVRRRIQWQSQVIIYGMLLFSLKYDLISGVVLGLGIALVITNTQFASLEVLKYHVSGSHFRSPVQYDHEEKKLLAEHGDRTQIIGLTGFLFEGVAIYLSRYLREVVRKHKDLDTLVLDFFACQGINDSACAHLVKVNRLCEADEVTLVFLNLHVDDQALLKSWNVSNFSSSLSTVLRDAELEILDLFGQPKTSILPKSQDGSTEERALATWLGPEAASELMKCGTLRALQPGIALDLDLDAGVIVAIPRHSEVAVEVRTGNKLRPATLMRTRSGAVCGAEVLISERSRGTWRTVSKSVVLQMQNADIWRAEHPTAYTALVSAAFQQQLFELDQLCSLYTVNRGGGWQGVTFDGITHTSGAKEMDKLGKCAARPSAPPSEQENEVLEEDGHLVAAVLERVKSPGGPLFPIAEAEIQLGKNHPAPDYLLINRDSVGAGLNQLKDFVPRRQKVAKLAAPLMDLFAEMPEDLSGPAGATKTTPLLPVTSAMPISPQVGKQRPSQRFKNALLTGDKHPLDDFRMQKSSQGSGMTRSRSIE